MKTVESDIHLAVAFDQNYLTPFFAWAASVLHHHPDGNVSIHAITSGITAEQQDWIGDYIHKRQSNIFFYDISQLSVSNLILVNNWTQAVYYRLYFSIILPEKVTRFLYMDVDTIVLNKLYELLSVDLEHYPIGAVYDNYVKIQPLIGIHSEDEYFNSGVMVIDRSKWIEQKITEKTLEFIKSNPEKIKFVDQCGLNAVLRNNWKKLDSKFNIMFSYLPPMASMIELKQLVKNSVVVHYTLERPWIMLCKNRLNYLYKHYYYQSPARKVFPLLTDYSLLKLPQLLKMKIFHFYYDYTFLSYWWKKLRSKTSK